MKSRTKKYFETSENDNMKGSATIAGYDEQNEKTIRDPKQNPAPSESKDKNQSKTEKNAANHNVTAKSNNS